MRMNEFAPSPEYGYSPQMPLMLGGRGQGDFGERLNELFLLLRSPRGEPLTFVQGDPCCPFRSEGSDALRELEVYEVSMDGGRPRRLYINSHASGPVYVPHRLLATKNADNFELIEEARQASTFGNYFRAAAILEPLAEDGDLLAQYELARAMSDQRDEDGAIQWLLRLAEAGHGVSQAAMASRFEEGIGVLRDLDAAKKWRRRAAANGDGASLVKITHGLLGGGGESTNDHQAAELLAAAAELGEPGAQAAYGLMLVIGRGVRQDQTAGLTWLYLARRAGDPNAREYYAALSPRLTSDAVARIERTATEWLTRPAPPQYLTLDQIPE